MAEATGVLIGVENVWNNLWVRPEFFKHFVLSCDSQWIQAYFDIANQVKYLIPPEQWIRTLGKLIIKTHVKDYKLTLTATTAPGRRFAKGASIGRPSARRLMKSATKAGERSKPRGRFRWRSRTGGLI